MTRIPPSAVGYWAGELEQNLKPLDAARLRSHLLSAGASENSCDAIVDEVRRLPIALQRYKLIYEAGVDPGHANVFLQNLRTAVEKLNELFEDTSADAILGEAERLSVDAHVIVSEFRCLAPLFAVVLDATERRIPQAVRGGNRTPHRQHLAMLLIDVFERHGLAIEAKRNSPMTLLYADLLEAAGEGSSRAAVGRPDSTLKKALEVRSAQQS